MSKLWRPERKSAVLCALLLWSTVMAGPTAYADAPPSDEDVPGGWLDQGGSINDEGTAFDQGASAGSPGTQTSTSDSAGSTRPGSHYEYMRHDCLEDASMGADRPACPVGWAIIVVCPSGFPSSLPIYGRWVDEATGVAEPWSLVEWYTCPDEADIRALVLDEWTSLAPTPTPLNLQPNTGWVYATVPTIAFTDDTPLIHQATLLGVPVRIRATPSQFTWSWGDGSETDTADAGSPYPDYSVSHTYLHFEGEVEVALQTTWSGDYSVNGGPWIGIDGTLTTQSGPVTVEVHDPQSRLVDCDLNNNCIVGQG